MASGTVTVTMKAKNDILDLEKVFYTETKVTLESDKNKLITFLEKAADQDTKFKFTATYYQGMGYYINAINDVFESKERQIYWFIEKMPGGERIPVGVSSYVPTDGETILFVTDYYTESGECQEVEN